MLKIVSNSNQMFAQVTDREGVTLVSHEVKDDVEAMDFFSHLFATLNEGFRFPIERK